jgi:hypothetical protein
LTARIDAVETNLGLRITKLRDDVGEHFQVVEWRLTNRIDKVDVRVARVEGKVDGIEVRLIRVEDGLDELRASLK